jgi:hypothetical protein
VKLTCYTINNFALDVVAAPSERDWITNTEQQFVRRCLPLMIANAHGWQILAQDSCDAVWNGGNQQSDIELKTGSGTDAHFSTHFGYGILTFRIHCILRTGPGINLWIAGPTNCFKDAIQPMSAVIESDWMPYTFTMNWQFTRPGTWVHFEKGEPVCQFFPVPRGIVDNAEPSLRDIKSDPELCDMHQEWRESRDAFVKGLKTQDPEAIAQKWQKHYFRGLYPDGSPAISEHQTKVRPREFSAKTDEF